jgi:hypothetical protein
MWNNTLLRLGVSVATGAALAAVDNLAFEGEASPILIVGLLLVATASAGAVWGRPGRG